MAQNISVDATITVDGNPYRVLSYSIEEALFEVSTLQCVIVKDTADAPDPAALIDKQAELKLARSDGTQKRSFVGKVIEAERATSEDDIREVSLTIAPDLWRLCKRADCRIFQTLSVTDVVKQVLTGAGVPAAQTQWKTTGSYPVRDYIAQYRETDLEFVLRLLSEEGIYFAITHEDGKDNVVFGDDPKGLGDITGTNTLLFRDTHGFQFGEDAVKNVQQTHQVRSDKVMLRDYNPKKPSLKLESKAEGTDPGAHALEVYDYPGRFDDKSVGDRYAKNLLTSMQAERQLVSGDTGVLTLQPGLRFTIGEHPYAPINQEYLIISVHTDGRMHRQGKRAALGGAASGEGESFACRFTGIPTKASPYAPPRRQRARVVPGTQTAVTTGPAGEEIYTDDGGHVKAQFYWDRLGKNDDKSSMWMRTSQLPTGGSMLLPRMKWEVAVSYLEGDVDKPYVMARMYNTATPPPYALPAHKGKSSIQTATTPGGGSSNEIRTCDDKGSEEMMMNASKDMSIDVGNNTTESIGANLTRQIGSNHNLNITDSLSASVGASQSVTVGGQQAINVQTFMVDQIGGSQTLVIGGARSMKIGGDHKRDVTADSTLSVGSMSIDLVVGSANEHGLADYKHNVSAALVEMTAGGRSIIVGGDRSEVANLAKVIVTAAGRSVDVSGSLSSKTAGLVYRKVDGNLGESASGGITEVAAGAQLMKAAKIDIEAQSLLSVVMGASTITMTPSAVVVAGVSIKVDGEVVDEGAMVLDN